ncbi:MAG: SDR family oxidoreductase [Conexibacter sp.]
MDTRGRKTILLTGASGVVGNALLPELGDHEVICLVNRGTVDGDHTIVHADVTQPRLGLAPNAYDELARRADCIVHSAAVTDWAAPKDRIRATNVEGTKNVLELVRAADAPLYFMSTAFICAIAPKAPLKLPSTHIIVNYVTSKLDSERVVRGSGLPATIFRPTNLVGDSRTGKIAREQIIQRVTGFVCRGRAPLYPTRRETLVDIIPQDILAKTVAAIIRDEDVGSEYWLTYGDRAFKVSRALELCVEFMDGIGRPISPPSTIDPDEIEARGDEIAALPPIARAFFARLLEFSDGMTACGVFPSDMDQLTKRYGLSQPSLEDAYMRGLDFWARSKGIRPTTTAGLVRRVDE